MNPPLVLRRSEWLDNWYVLSGGGNWASVEGSSAEWREIAAYASLDAESVRLDGDR